MPGLGMKQLRPGQGEPLAQGCRGGAGGGSFQQALSTLLLDHISSLQLHHLQVPQQLWAEVEVTGIGAKAGRCRKGMSDGGVPGRWAIRVLIR